MYNNKLNKNIYIMNKNDNIIPQIIYLMILNINYNTIFDNLRFQFKNQIYYLEVCSIIFFLY